MGAALEHQPASAEYFPVNVEATRAAAEAHACLRSHALAARTPLVVSACFDELRRRGSRSACVRALLRTEACSPKVDALVHAFSATPRMARRLPPQALADLSGAPTPCVVTVLKQAIACAAAHPLLLPGEMAELEAAEDANAAEVFRTQVPGERGRLLRLVTDMCAAVTARELPGTVRALAASVAPGLFPTAAAEEEPMAMLLAARRGVSLTARLIEGARLGLGAEPDSDDGADTSCSGSAPGSGTQPREIESGGRQSREGSGAGQTSPSGGDCSDDAARLSDTSTEDGAEDDDFPTPGECLFERHARRVRQSMGAGAVGGVRHAGAPADAPAGRARGGRGLAHSMTYSPVLEEDEGAAADDDDEPYGTAAELALSQVILVASPATPLGAHLPESAMLNDEFERTRPSAFASASAGRRGRWRGRTGRSPRGELGCEDEDDGEGDGRGELSSEASPTQLCFATPGAHPTHSPARFALESPSPRTAAESSPRTPSTSPASRAEPSSCSSSTASSGLPSLADDWDWEEQAEADGASEGERAGERAPRGGRGLDAGPAAEGRSSLLFAAGGGVASDVFAQLLRERTAGGAAAEEELDWGVRGGGDSSEGSSRRLGRPSSSSEDASGLCARRTPLDDDGGSCGGGRTDDEIALEPRSAATSLTPPAGAPAASLTPPTALPAALRRASSGGAPAEARAARGCGGAGQHPSEGRIDMSSGCSGGGTAGGAAGASLADDADSSSPSADAKARQQHPLLRHAALEMLAVGGPSPPPAPVAVPRPDASQADDDAAHRHQQEAEPEAGGTWAWLSPKPIFIPTVGSNGSLRGSGAAAA